MILFRETLEHLLDVSGRLVKNHPTLVFTLSFDLDELIRQLGLLTSAAEGWLGQSELCFLNQLGIGTFLLRYMSLYKYLS